MKINGKCYCDVCLEQIEEIYENCFSFPDEDKIQERNYCKDHRVIYNLWNEINNGKDVGKLTFPNKEESKPGNKELPNLELYDILSGLFKTHYGYLVDHVISDKDVVEYYKNSLAADINYNRLKVKGKIENKEKEETKC